MFGTKYRWHVDLLLKDRDGKIQCIWSGTENNSTAVAERIVSNKRPEDFVGMLGLSENHNVLIRVGEIVVMDIYPAP